MKAEITIEGTLEIIPENNLEAYALARWSEKNFDRMGEVDMLFHTRPKETDEQEKA